MIVLSLLGFFCVGNALAHLIALMAPQSRFARIWNPVRDARAAVSSAMLAYRRRLLLVSAALYLWLGLWVALYVLFDRELGNAAFTLSFAVPLAVLIPLLLVVRGRPRV